MAENIKSALINVDRFLCLLCTITFSLNKLGDLILFLMLVFITRLLSGTAVRQKFNDGTSYKWQEQTIYTY